jgi:archaemetzincin
MHSILLPVALALLSSASGSVSPDSRPVVAIQPLGPLRHGIVEMVTAGIERRYDVRVVVLPERALPEAAFYKPRQRYRAERLLDALERESAGRYAKIVGLTARDISTSTERHADFGIFGLGDLGGTPCVVSTFRLGRGGADEVLFNDRLVKAVNHELGHTFGVEHCSVDGCLMADASGTMKRVDAGRGVLCAACLERLHGTARNVEADNVTPVRPTLEP